MAETTPKKIKLLHIIHTLQVGGAEMVLYNLCKGLLEQTKRPFEITIACTLETGPVTQKIEALGIKVINLNCTGIRFYKSIWRVIRLIRQIKPDIVHTHLFPPDRYGQVAAFLCGVRVRISTIHNMEPELTSVERMTIRILKLFATRLIAVSSSAKMHYVNKFSIPPDKIIVIYNTSGHFPPSDRGSPLPIPSKPFRIINYDNVKFAKGQLHLIPVMKELHAVEPEARLDILGDSTGEYAESLKREIEKNGLKGVIRLLGRTTDPFKVLPDYHLMLSLSLWEGFHMTLVEGMSIGLPILTTPIGPHLELFEGNEQVFVKHDDPSGIAGKILAVLTDSKLFSSLSEANLTRSAAFAPVKMVQNYIDLYTGFFPYGH